MFKYSGKYSKVKECWKFDDYSRKIVWIYIIVHDSSIGIARVSRVFPLLNLRHKDKQNIFRHTHDHSSFRFFPVSVRGGMHPYHHAIKEEKLLSSKKVMSFLQRYWKGVISSESCCSAASGANCK